jgi:hypothetical protein
VLEAKGGADGCGQTDRHDASGPGLNLANRIIECKCHLKFPDAALYMQLN